MQIIVRHPLLTDAVSAGVAVCQGILPETSEAKLHAGEEEATAQTQPANAAAASAEQDSSANQEERDFAFASEELAVTALREIIADTPACRVGLACYGRRVVGVAAMVPTASHGLETKELPVRARELRYFKILEQYYDDALAQRLIDFVTSGIEPAQIWLPRRGTRNERAFLRTQGFTSDATWETVAGIEYARLVR